MEKEFSVSFTEEEAETLNQGLEILRRHGAKVSPKSFIKKEALARANHVLKSTSKKI